VTYRHYCTRSLYLRANERERVMKKTRGREREQEWDSDPDTTDEEGTILIGRMRGRERMLVGGERDQV